MQRIGNRLTIKGDAQPEAYKMVTQRCVGIEMDIAFAKPIVAKVLKHRGNSRTFEVESVDIKGHTFEKQRLIPTCSYQAVNRWVFDLT